MSWLEEFRYLNLCGMLLKVLWFNWECETSTKHFTYVKVWLTEVFALPWLWRYKPGCDVTRIPAFIQDGGSWRTTGLSFVEINVVVLHKNRFIYLNCPMAVMCSIRKYQTKVLKKPRSDILPYNDQAVQVNKRFCYLCSFSVSLSDARNVRLYVLAVHRPFYISICISTLPTQHTTFIIWLF